MDRELGSNVMDLPHAYIPDTGQPDSECRCGRDAGHELHSSTPVQERASAYAGPTVITEKGV